MLSKEQIIDGILPENTKFLACVRNVKIQFLVKINRHSEGL